MIVLIKLLFAHLLSDFVLQTDQICKGKKQDGWIKYGYHISHALIHAGMAYLLVAQWNNWLVPIIIFITHLSMDFLKSTYLKEQLHTLIIDQIFHITIIFILWLFLYNNNEFIWKWISGNWNNIHLWYTLSAYLLVLKPASVFLNLFIKRWKPEENEMQSLPHAGKWIGYLERILILTFIQTGNIEGLGFYWQQNQFFVLES